jgi:hypothetical protein
MIGEKAAEMIAAEHGVRLAQFVGERGIALRAAGNGERLAAAGCRRPQTATQLQVNLGPSRIGLALAALCPHLPP